VELGVDIGERATDGSGDAGADGSGEGLGLAAGGPDALGAGEALGASDALGAGDAARSNAAATASVGTPALARTTTPRSVMASPLRRPMRFKVGGWKCAGMDSSLRADAERCPGGRAGRATRGWERGRHREGQGRRKPDESGARRPGSERFGSTPRAPAALRGWVCDGSALGRSRRHWPVQASPWGGDEDCRLTTTGSGPPVGDRSIRPSWGVAARDLGRTRLGSRHVRRRSLADLSECRSWRGRR
jgi:hypothetical protein